MRLFSSLPIAALSLCGALQLNAEGVEPLPKARAVAAYPPWERIAPAWTCPEWYKDAKFGLWLHWGPQAVPLKGGGWYARHMYQQYHNDSWGKGAWEYHRATYGPQSEFGFKDICRLWKAEKFDAADTVLRMKRWGARFVTILGNHHDNFDLFASSVHGWNSTRVGPMRDLVGEFAEAARKNQLRWGVSVHAARAAAWFRPASGADKDGPLKGVPYDGNLTKADGAGKWWEGLDPRQLYASKYPRFEKELTQRHLELVRNYRPDLLYFDDRPIQAAMLPACVALYEQSRTADGAIQAVVTIKEPQVGAVHDIEKGVTAELMPDWWQTDTTLASDWFFKPSDDGLSRLRHDARSLKELLVDIVSKRGVLMLNISIRADGSIPDEQAAILDDVGAWLQGIGEAIYETRPWKIYGEGGETAAGRGRERGIGSAPWDMRVVRFTQDKAGKVLYVHVFGNPAGKTLTLGALARSRNLFPGAITAVRLLAAENLPAAAWTMEEDGLHVTLPERMPFADANVIRISTSGL